MKKLYTLALAAAVAMTASAQQRSTEVIKLSKFNKVAEEMVLPISKTTTMKAASRATTIEDLVGEYEFNCSPLLQGMSSKTSVVITATGETTINIQLGTSTAFPNVLPATVDLTAGTVSIANKIELGEDKYGDVMYFYLKNADSSGKLIEGASSAAATVGTIEDGSIVFPQMDIWAIADYNDESAGYWWLSYKNEIVTPEPAPEMGGTWQSVGKATFIDAWCLPGIPNASTGLPYDNTQFPWSVDVEQDVDNLYRFRVVSAYIAANCPVSTGNSAGYIVFNIEDPTFVVFETDIYSGLNNGSEKLNLFNVEGFYYYVGNYDKEAIMTGLEMTEEDCSSYADGRVTIKNARFNMPGALDKFYTWTFEDADGQPVSCAPYMKGEILFDEVPNTGIEKVTVDQNAPAEYFNLQGMRVDNPANGIFIRRQGNTATKVRF